MDPILTGLLGMAGLLVLLLLGMPIAYAGALAGFIGILSFVGWEAAVQTLGFLPNALGASYTYSVIPLFILMGYLAFEAGLTEQVYSTARAWVGHIRGGLAIATTFGCAGFGAASGSSTAAAAVMSKVAVPEMLRYRYDRRLAAGVVAASGTLATLIPPSANIVVCAILTEQSAGKLLLAGFLPGIVSALLYATMLFFLTFLRPNIWHPYPAISWRQRFISLKNIWAILLIIFLVIGGLYSGVFTPTEAGGAGAFITFLLWIFSRHRSWIGFKTALLQTGCTTVMIFLIIIGILIFMRFLALSGFTQAAIDWAVGLSTSRWVILGGIALIYVILGMFTTVVSMMALTLPIVFPIILAYGFDPIWFGIIVIKLAEICLITPPVGLNVYVVSGTLGEPAAEVFRGVLPFFIMDLITLGLLVLVPQIILLVPSYMR